MTEDQELWELLGRAPRSDAPPFFAAKVMRAIGTPARTQAPWFAAVLRWFAPATIAALVVLALIPRPETAPATASASGELTTLELVEILSPDDYIVLTTAGWHDDTTDLLAGF